MNQRHVLSIVGPAGCGKGTCCTYLKGLGANVITTSEVLKDYALKYPAQGEIIREYKIKRKINVPDSIVSEAMIWKLHPLFRQYHSGLFGLDGFGRGAEQIKHLADWINNRNIDYERRAISPLKHGYVFLSLSFEETMSRVEKRVQKALQLGEIPRDEDLGDHPKLRFEAYSILEDHLITTARLYTGQVHIIDLSAYTTLQAAAMIHGATYNVNPDIVANQLREEFKVA